MYMPPSGIQTELGGWLKLQNKPQQEMQRRQRMLRDRAGALDKPLPFEAKTEERPSSQPTGNAVTEQTCLIREYEGVGIEPTIADDTNELYEEDTGGAQESYRQTYSLDQLSQNAREVPHMKLPDEAFQIGGGLWKAQDSQQRNSKIVANVSNLLSRGEQRRTSSPPPSRKLEQTREEEEDEEAQDAVGELPVRHPSMQRTGPLAVVSTPPSSFFATQDIREAMANPSTPPTQTEKPDLSRVHARAQTSIIGRSNVREPKLP